jgi:hypothetical protein
MGFLKSTIQVRSRYERCKQAWASHLRRTRECILTAAEMSPGRRKAVLFGAGLLHDIPLAELSRMFEEVWLADIVHSLPGRLSALRFGNVRLVELDVTGVVAELPALRRSPGRALPVSQPRRFLEDPRLDFAVSVNLLSQLPWVPGRFLGGTRPEQEVAGFQAHLILSHLEYLRRLPGHTALITDAFWRAEPAAAGAAVKGGEEAPVWDVLSGVVLPEPESTWDWLIAPAPERDERLDYIAKVHAYPDWKTSSA